MNVTALTEASIQRDKPKQTHTHTQTNKDTERNVYDIP